MKSPPLSLARALAIVAVFALGSLGLSTTPSYSQAVLGGQNLNGVPPANSIGQESQWYIDFNSGKLYGPKSSGFWPASFGQLLSSVGPQTISGLWTFNGGISVPAPLTQTMSATVAGAPSTGLGYIQTMNVSGTNTSTVGANVNLINVTDSASVSNGGNGVFLNALTVQDNMGSALITGGRQGIQSYIFQTVATATTNNNRNYVGMLGGAATSSGDGGFAGAGGQTGCGVISGNTYCGAWFGFNSIANASGGSYLLNIASYEANFQASGVSHIAYITGMQVAAMPGHSVHADIGEAELSIGSQPGATLLNQLISFVDWNGQVPFGTSSTLIGASWSGAQSAGSLIDLVTNSKGGSLTCTGNDILLPNFTVTCAGIVTAQTVNYNGPAIFANTVALQFKDSTGVYTNGSHGSDMFVFTDNSVYWDDFNGSSTVGFLWRLGNSSIQVAKLTTSAFTLGSGVGFSMNGAAGISTVCTVTVGNTLTFTNGILTTKGANCT
jgi:hypothetical protein